MNDESAPLLKPLRLKGFGYFVSIDKDVGFLESE